MDIHSSHLLLLLPSLLFIVFTLLVLRVKPKRRDTPPPPPPPGPWKLPIIGNLHQLLGSQTPHHRLRDLANKHGPLMFLQLGQVPHVVISSPDVAKQVLKTHDLVFAQRPSYVSADIAFFHGEGISFAPYGEYWRQMRNICAQTLLHAPRVRSFRPIREEQVSKLLLAKCSACNVVDLSRMLFRLTYAVISKAAFGLIPKKREDSFRKIVDGVSQAVAGLSIADLFPSISFLHDATGFVTKSRKLHLEANKILDNIVSEHRNRRALGKKSGDHNGDLVDVLLDLQPQVTPPLTDNKIKAVIMDMFVAGAATTSMTIEWAMSELMKHPNVMEKAQAEARLVFDEQGKVTEDKINDLNYLKLVIKETLRLHAPLPLLALRENVEPCEINGYHIPAKTRVIVNAWALSRDPDYWVEPQRFDPERFVGSEIGYRGTNFEYLPFGGGRRICPGILFGMAGVEFPLASLLYHFDWELPGGKKAESLDMDEASGGAVRRKNALELVPVLRRPVPVDA